ncbi:MAG: cell division protein ZapA [bacterium]|nr:cell division protein ZapA [bacterium]
MSDQQQIKISVLGTEYKVKTDKDSSHIRKIEEYLNNKISEISNNTHIASSLKITTWAALFIAEEFLSYKEKNEKHAQKIDDIIEKIDKTNLET